MPTFTKELIRSYRNTMFKEMEEVARKYGVKVEFGNVRYQADEFGVKMTATDPTAKRGEEIIASRLGGNAKIQVGTYVAHPARASAMRVVEVTARGSVIVQTNRGARYRLKMEDYKQEQWVAQARRNNESQ